MSLISYAQNFEDVMLWRALKDVDNGFYIDVGAWSPDIDSVTRSFYENGWRGINIEPSDEYYPILLGRRPRDINLKLAVGSDSSKCMMTFIAESGLSTFDSSLAAEYETSGFKVSKNKVYVKALSDIWREYVPAGQNVHFLKVDVEGFEDDVLRSNDWLQFRPWILVVEAMRPLVQEESHANWEPLLIDSGYLFAYADGLNRFYVAKEHKFLLESFKYPPNIFDNFIHGSYANIINSRSWKISAPLRLLNKILKWA